MDRYPSIGDHGLIDDLQTRALVTTDGTVDWFRCPFRLQRWWPSACTERDL
jgi:hypothetical protein